MAKAKTFYKNSLLDSAYGTGIVDLLAKQIAADTIISPLKAADAVDAVTTADVKQVSTGECELLAKLVTIVCSKWEKWNEQRCFRK